MANLIERSFRLAFSSTDVLESLIAAIRRRTEDLNTNQLIKGPFILRMPRWWLRNLCVEYATSGMTILERILEEKISGVEFVVYRSSYEAEFSLVLRLPDIRRRV
jgi:hypothetical protein